jgi:hypothetical protein
VTYPSGGVIEGAEIALTSVATGITRTAVSNTSGNYGFVDVLPGAYTMKVAKEGFTAIVQPQFTLYVNQTATFDFHLTVGSTHPALNGQRNRSNMFLLDGINNLGSFIGNYNISPIVDTVQEFKVQSHNDEAAFGQAVGGIVNVVTKSGTNQFHGALWEFLRNEQLDARNFFLARRNPLRQNQFGGAAGGPVWIPKVYNSKNRAFFYGGYEGYRQSQATQNLLLVPTTAQLGGNFSGISNQLYNPLSTRPDPARPGQFLRDAFPNNQIPANLLNPALLYARTTLFPTAGAALPSGTNFADATPARVNQDTYNGRIDQTFSEHDVLFGRISYFNQNDTNSAGFPGAVNQVVIEGWNWALHETHTFGPPAVLDTHFGRNWGDDLNAKTSTRAPANFISQLQQLGFSSNFVGGFQACSGFQTSSAPVRPLSWIPKRRNPAAGAAQTRLLKRHEPQPKGTLRWHALTLPVHCTPRRKQAAKCRL